MGNRLKFIAIKFFKNSYDADDLVQDFWLDIKKHCSKFWYSTNGYGYLAKILQNMAITKLRKASKRQPPLTLNDIIEFEDKKYDFERTIRQASLCETFERGMNLMTEEERKVFALICYEEMTVRGIAKELNISKSTAERLRQSALKILGKILAEEGWDKA